MPAPLTFFFAFVAVLALIGLAAWLVRRFAGSRLGANTNRSRMPRLAVIDAAAVDGRRRLVLVRRDNIEHLLMIGGPTDIVVESNIVRATHAREQLPQRTAESLPPRIAPLPEPQVKPDNEAAKADVFELPEPSVPELASRPLRPAFGDEGRRAGPTMAERRAEVERRAEMAERREPPVGFPPEGLLGRPEPRQESRSELRGEPRESRPERLMPRGEPSRGESGRSSEPMRSELIMPRALRPAESPRPEPTRLEPTRPEPTRPVELTRSVESPKAPSMRAPERVAAPLPPPPMPPLPLPPSPPSPQPQQNAEANLAEMAQRLEAALRRPPGEPLAAVPAGTEPPPNGTSARNEQPIAAPAPAPKSSFENLEDEMAFLLGRPKSSS